MASYHEFHDRKLSKATKQSMECSSEHLKGEQSPLILSPEWRRRREASFSYQLPRSIGDPVPTAGATLTGRCRAEVSVVSEESPAVAAPGPSPGSCGCPNSPCLPDIWYFSPPARGFLPSGTAWLPRDPCMALRDVQLRSEGHQAGKCFLLSVQMGGPKMHDLLLQCPRQQAPAYLQWLPGNSTPSFFTSPLRPCYLSPRLSSPQTLLSREALYDTKVGAGEQTPMP